MFLRAAHCRWFLAALLFALPARAFAQAPPAPAADAEEKQFAQWVEQARHPDKVVRCSALRRLGFSRKKTAVPPLLGGLSDADPQVRVVAVEALGRIGDPSTARFVAARLADLNPAVAGAAARAVTGFAKDQVLPLLISLLRHETPGVRAQALAALRELTGLDFGFDPDGKPDARAESDKSWRSWWAAVKDREEWTWPLEALRSPSPRDRASAAVLLGDRREARALGELVGALWDESEAVREQAARALQLITLLSHDYDAFAPVKSRQAAIEAWKQWAAEHGGEPREQWLLAGVDHPEGAVRARAARELGTVGGRRSIGPLVGLLNDPVEGVREAAHEALRALTEMDFQYDPRADEDSRRDGMDRWRLWWAANEGREKKDWLRIALLKDPAPKNRVRAAAALARLRDPLVVGDLIRALQDPVPGVREAACRVLSGLAGQGFGFDADGTEEDRAAAVVRWQQWWAANQEDFQFPPAGMD